LIYDCLRSSDEFVLEEMKIFTFCNADHRLDLFFVETSRYYRWGN
jgi:hypothetical protein